MPRSQPADLPAARVRILPRCTTEHVSEDLVDRIKGVLPDLKVSEDRLRYRLAVAIASARMLNSIEPDPNHRAATKKGAAKAANEARKLVQTLDGLSDTAWQMLSEELGKATEHGSPVVLRKLDSDIRELHRAANVLAQQKLERGPLPYGQDDRAVSQLACLYEELTAKKWTHWLRDVEDENSPNEYAQHRVPDSSFAKFVHLLMAEIDLGWTDARLRTALDKIASRSPSRSRSRPKV